MDGSRIGRGLRAIRLRARLRQSDVSGGARVPRDVVARIERGDLDGVRVGQLRAAVVALRADLDIVLRWNGADLDRLLNAGHSAMHELVVGILTEAGWEVLPERSFSIWGERGVIDIVAWRAPSRTLLIVELKPEIVEVQRLIGTVDRPSGPLLALSFLSDVRVANRTAARSSRRRVRTASRAVTGPGRWADPIR